MGLETAPYDDPHEGNLKTRKTEARHTRSQSLLVLWRTWFPENITDNMYILFLGEVVELYRHCLIG